MVNNLANPNTKKTKPLIKYNTNGYPICLNDYKDEYYFTRVFSILFLFRDSKYLAKGKMAILL